MDRDPGVQTSSAFAWRAAELASTKIIALLRILVVAHLMPPREVGLMVIAAVAVEAAQSLTDMGVLAALIQGRSADEERYHAAWTLGLGRGAAVTTLLAVAAPAIAAAFGHPEAGPVLVVLALRPLLEATASVRMARLFRRLDFRRAAAPGVCGSLVETAVAIGLATSLGVWALVAGSLAGVAARVAVSYLVAPYRPRLALPRDHVASLVRFGRWIWVGGSLAVIASWVFQLVVSRVLGAAALGVYFLAARVSFLPSEVAVEVGGRVSFPLFARLRDDQEATARTFAAVAGGLLALLVPAYGLLFVLAPLAAGRILDDEWLQAVPLIQILALSGAISLLGDTFLPLYKALGHTHKVALLELGASAALVAGVLVLTPQGGLVGAAVAWVPSSVVFVAVGIGLAPPFLRGQVGHLLRTTCAVIAATVGGAATAASAASVGTTLLRLAWASALGGTAAALALLLLDRLLGLRLSASIIALLRESRSVAP